MMLVMITSKKSENLRRQCKQFWHEGLGVGFHVCLAKPFDMLSSLSWLDGLRSRYLVIHNHFLATIPGGFCVRMQSKPASL